MARTEIDAQWQLLCDEQEQAKTNYYKAFAAVGRKFGAVGNDSSSVNPTTQELASFESAWDAWENVKERMVRFVKTHA